MIGSNTDQSSDQYSGGGFNDNQFGNGPQNPKRPSVALIIGLIFLASLVWTLITEPERLARSLMGLVLMLGLLILSIRSFGFVMTRLLRFGTLFPSEGVKCPYCGCKTYSVRVERTGWTKDPNTMTPKERRAENIARAACVLTYGLSDRILKLIPGQHPSPYVHHESIGTCASCHGSWKMKRGSYW